MTEYCGLKFLLQLGTDDVVPVYTTIGCLRDATITINREQVDVTTKDSNQIREILGSCGVKTVSISGSGVFSDDANMGIVQVSAQEGTHKRYKLISDRGDSYEGRFEVASFERSGSYNNAEEASFSLESAEMIVYTPVILQNANYRFDATNTASMVFNTGKVQEWNNPGISGGNFIQNDLAKMPVLNTNGPNGTTVLEFSETENMATLPGSVQMADSCTVFVVFKPIKWLKTTNNMVFHYGPAASEPIVSIESGNQTDTFNRFGLEVDTDVALWTPDRFGNDQDIYEDAMFVACATFDFPNNTGRLYVNGGFKGKTTTYTTGINSAGASDFALGIVETTIDGFSVQYGEIVQIDSYLPIEERRAIEAYLAGKWGCQLNLTEDPAI